MGHHRGLQRSHVRRPAVVVDVQPVGLGADGDDVGARRAISAGRGGRGGAVCAVHDDGQAVEAGGDGLACVAEVAVQRVLGVDHTADARAGRPGTGALVDQFLDPVLGRVVQLVAPGTEDLDAVVGHRVVRRADHHAEVGVVRACEVGHGRGRQHADPQCVHALAGDPGDHRGFEHLTAGPGVAADDGHAAGTCTDTAEPSSRRRTQRQRQLRGQILVGDAAHPVGAEQSSHADKLLTDHTRSPKRRGY